jgi:glycosyltransferase involved in cell wall biosynthesis
MAPRKKLDLSLVLPTFNEESHFTSSVARIIRILSYTRLHYEIIFVDDKSEDGTTTLIQKVLLKHPKWKSLFHRKNLGRGRSVTDGIEIAKGKVVGFIDIDLEVSPVYIAEMTEMILSDEAEVVIGHRTNKSTVNTLFGEFISGGCRFLSQKMFGTGNLDTQCGYKFFNRKKILPVLAQCHHPRWFWDTEIMVFARRANLRIHEVPVLFIRRTDKTSSVYLWEDTMDYIESLWKLWHRMLKK